MVTFCLCWLPVSLCLELLSPRYYSVPFFCISASGLQDEGSGIILTTGRHSRGSAVALRPVCWLWVYRSDKLHSRLYLYLLQPLLRTMRAGHCLGDRHELHEFYVCEDDVVDCVDDDNQCNVSSLFASFNAADF